MPTSCWTERMSSSLNYRAGWSLSHTIFLPHTNTYTLPTFLLRKEGWINGLVFFSIVFFCTFIDSIVESGRVMGKMLRPRFELLGNGFDSFRKFSNLQHWGSGHTICFVPLTSIHMHANAGDQKHKLMWISLSSGLVNSNQRIFITWRRVTIRRTTWTHWENFHSYVKFQIVWIPTKMTGLIHVFPIPHDALHEIWE